VGIFPVKVLLLILKEAKPESAPTSDGMVPENLLLSSKNIAVSAWYK